MSRNHKQLLSRIEELREAIRHKYKQYKQGSYETEHKLRKQYNPLITELKKVEPKVVFNSEVKKEENKYEMNQEFDPKVFSSPNSKFIAPSAPNDSFFPKRLYTQSYEPINNEETFETSDKEDTIASNVTNVLGTDQGLESASHYVNSNFKDAITRKYMLKLMKDLGGSKRTVDHTFGPRFEGDKLMIGDRTLDFDEYGNILVADTSYKPTEGIYELLFKRIPDEEVYNEDDLNAYKDILVKTNGHKKGYKRQGHVNRDNSLKYKYVIEKIFPKILYGKGILTKNMYEPDHFYWEDVNDLVDRLRLIVASAEAGNTGHKNEIINIVEELRKHGYIKGQGNERYWSLLK